MPERGAHAEQVANGCRSAMAPALRRNVVGSESPLAPIVGRLVQQVERRDSLSVSNARVLCAAQRRPRHLRRFLLRHLHAVLPRRRTAWRSGRVARVAVLKPGVCRYATASGVTPPNFQTLYGLQRDRCYTVTSSSDGKPGPRPQPASYRRRLGLPRRPRPSQFFASRSL